MKRISTVVVFFLVVTGVVQSQEAVVRELFEPGVFREAIDMRSSLATVVRAVDDPELWDQLTTRMLFIDGMASTVSIYADDEQQYYAEIELVTGAWHGVERVEMYRAWVVLDDPIFSGRIAERAPRDPDPELILRNHRVLVAARLVDVFVEDDGNVVPVLVAYDIRSIQ